MTEQDRCRRLVSMITDLASKMSLDELKEAYDFLFDLQRDGRDRASHTPITAVQSNTCNQADGHVRRVAKLREQMAAERGNDEPTVPGRVM